MCYRSPVDIGNSDKVVVNCILTIDSIQTLSLHYSAEVGDYSFKEVKDAKIELFENDVLAGNFYRVTYGAWKLDYCPKKGAQYKLVITLDDGTIVQATTIMPANNEIVPVISKNSSRDFKQLTANYPCWIFTLGHVNGVAEKTSYYPDKEYSLSGSPCSNHPFADNFNQAEVNDSLLSFLYYIRTNCGEVDYFTPVNFHVGNYTEFIFFRTTSFEYDKYMKSSLQKMNLRLAEGDPSIWFDESIVYSNVENGLGIFGAYSDHYFFYLWQELVYESKDKAFIEF